jgi:hypothetical protein
MADDRQSGSGLGGSSVVALVAAAASAIYLGWQKPPLTSSRPTDPETRIEEFRSSQDIEARLWQDPLAAVSRDLAEQHKDPSKPDDIHSIKVFANSLDKSNPDGGTLIIGVTLPGAPYPEESESRRRLRYAVLAALHVANYAPTDEKHLGYFLTAPQKPSKKAPPEVMARLSGTLTISADRNLPLDASLVLAANNSAKSDEPADAAKASPLLPSTIPFEWFHSNRDPHAHERNSRAVVLWINEEVLSTSEKPICNIQLLMHDMQLQTRKNVKFTLIGPQDSTTLTRMVEEIKNKRPSGSSRMECKDAAGEPIDGETASFSIYNFGATAEDHRVLELAGSKEAGGIEALFKRASIYYYRTVASDQKLADELVRELYLRDIDPKVTERRHSRDRTNSSETPRDHIALISEWDTVYGQSLPESICRALVNRTAASEKYNSHQSCEAASAKWIMRFSYLRGLDGRLPNRRFTKATGAPEEESKELTTGEQASVIVDNSYKLESAEGQSQFDYLRRLAEVIHQRDAELQRTGEGRIAAIGILGSDVYDKLLILQALRPDFPDSVFFTTDLDELLLPQEKKRYTRNLLVASGYGLKLIHALQGDIPPFRSTYQTSIFLATCLAIRNAWDEVEDRTRTALKQWVNHPRLFQIGRTEPYALPADPADLSDTPTSHLGNDRRDPCVDDILSCRSVQFTEAGLFIAFGSRARVGAGLILTVLLLTALFSSRNVRQLCFPRLAQTSSSAPFIQPRLGPLMLLFAAALAISLGLSLSWNVIGHILTENRLGDPMSLFEGISVWPTIVLRVIGCVASLYMIWYSLRRLEENQRETERDLGLHHSDASLCKQLAGMKLRHQSTIDRVVAAIVAILWFQPRNDQPPENRRRPTACFEEVSGGFSVKWQARCIRAAIGTLMMVLVWNLILVPIFGDLRLPARGDRAREIYSAVTRVEVIATLFLIFLVADATMCSRVFIKRLTAVSTLWPPKTIAQFQLELNMDCCYLADWIDMQYLARRTRCITRLIYFPFLALALLIASRSQLFDAFSTPWTLVIAQAISLAVVIGSVLALRSAAEDARTVACEHLTSKIIAAKRRDEKTASQLEMMLNQIENLKEGAFAPLSSQPFVKALLLPLLSYGGGLLVHLYALPGT